MRKKQYHFSLVWALVLLLGLTACHSGQKTKVLKLAHGLSPDHSVHKAMMFMAKRVKEKSNGKLTVEIYPSGQLGSEQQCVELLQIGSLAITKVSAAVMEGFTKKYKVLGLPYIFHSKEHSFNVLDGAIGKELLQEGEKYWIRGLCFYDAGSRSFYTKNKPIQKPEDLKGLKIRVMKSPTSMAMVKALGGNPTPISWGELYAALQNGVVDGAENNPPSFYLSHHYEVCKHYSINEHSRIPDVMIMSKIIWDRLSDQERQWLQEAANESVNVQRKLWEESEKEALEEVKKAGVKIYYPDKAPFAKKVEDMYEQYQQEPEVYNMIKKIQAIQ